MRNVQGIFTWTRAYIKNAKRSGCFYMSTDIWGDFQICISVPLTIGLFQSSKIKSCHKFELLIN